MRTHEVADGGTFTQKFRARDHGKIDRLGLGTLHNVGNPVTGSDRNRGFVDQHQRCGHILRNGSRSCCNVLQVRGAI